jgi:hypothetical protein
MLLQGDRNKMKHVLWREELTEIRRNMLYYTRVTALGQNTLYATTGR